jgi:hypothetical protein
VLCALMSVTMPPSVADRGALIGNDRQRVEIETPGAAIRRDLVRRGVEPQSSISPVRHPGTKSAQSGAKSAQIQSRKAIDPPPRSVF